jgi:hypothetical protein
LGGVGGYAPRTCPPDSFSSIAYDSIWNRWGGGDRICGTGFGFTPRSKVWGSAGFIVFSFVFRGIRQQWVSHMASFVNCVVSIG